MSAGRAPAPRDRGELALVLHSHMPYVEGFGTWPFGEEWLFEAIATSYLPLLRVCERLAADGRRDVLTIGVTPVLADQLALAEVGERFLRFLREVRTSAHRIDEQGLKRSGQGPAAAALRRSARHYERADADFERLGRDLLGALSRLRDAGAIELWTSAATHAVLPLVASEAGVRLQLQTGIDAHRARFDAWSGGFWLPECAYRPGLDEQLSAAGVRAFCAFLRDGDALASLEPVATASSTVAVPIDWETISLVWDERGYPADPVYRDYHTHTPNGLRPFANGGGPYDADSALVRAGEHAADFVERVLARLARYRAERGRPGLVVCALDTELLGHWWHEGPAWLEAVVERADAGGLALTTLPAALERHQAQQSPLRESSWGTGRDLRTWDSPAVADLVWPARRAELALLRATRGRAGAAGEAALARAASELLALQSSDWAFMATRRLAADYPDLRVRHHADELERALGVLARELADCRDMPAGDTGAVEPRLRGLAPWLSLAALREPPSPWGRDTTERS